MTVPTIGLNLSAMTSSPPPIPVWTNFTATEFIDYIPQNANTLTGGYYGIFVLLTLAIFLFWLFSDKERFGQFRYSILRGFGLSMGITLIFGIQMIQIGYIVNLVHLGYLLGFYVLMNIYILIKNPN